MSFLDTLFGPPDVGKLREKRDVGGLVKALRHSSSLVRGAAALALGEVGDERAVDPLMTALADGDEHVAGYAADSLARLGVQRAVRPALAASLRVTNSSVLPSTARRIGPRAIPALVELLAEADSGYDQYRIVRVLADLGDAAALEPLSRACSDADSEIADAGVDGLRRLGRRDAIPGLFAALDHANSNVRVHAVYALAQLGDTGVVDRLLPIAVTTPPDRYEYVQWAAISALGKLGDRRAVDPLIGLLPAAAPDVLWRAIEALGLIRDSRAVGPITAMLDHDSDHVRKHAVEALGRLAAVETVPAIERALHDRSESVRQTAEAALAAVGGVAAAGVLASHGAQRQELTTIDLNRLLNVIISAPEPGLRADALEALIDRQEPVEDCVLTRILYRSTDSRVRDRALERLRNKGHVSTSAATY